MQQINDEHLKNPNYLLYIHTPFCGTCHIANRMLTQIEAAHKKDIFYEMNASLYPEYMWDMQVESVPCLLIKVNNEVKEKVYAFQSIPNIYHYLLKYKPKLF